MKLSLILFFLFNFLFFACQKQEKIIIETEVFVPNSYQNKLYSIWSLYYSDSITAKKERKKLFRNSTSWSVKEEQERLQLLSNDYLTANNFEVIDSMALQGSWINCGENSDKSIDTLIEIKLHCILAKINQGNHFSWIIKRFETTTKHINDIKVAIEPDIYYVIFNENNIASGISVYINVRQGRSSSGNLLAKVNFEYDENQKTLNQELQRKLFVHTLLDTKKLGYKNASEKYEGDFFIDSNKILK